MNPSRWHLANSLLERGKLRAQLGLPFDSAVADRRLKRWSANLQFGERSLLPQVHELGGFGEEDFKFILGEKVDEQKHSPQWAQRLEQILTAADESKRVQENGGELLVTLWPLTRHFRNELENVLREYKSSEIDTATLTPYLIEPVLARLMRWIQRTGVLEANIARVDGVSKGETARERFEHFLNSFHDKNRCREFLLQYPVMARACLTILDQWLVATREFLDRLQADRTALARWLEIGQLGPAQKIRGNLGDAHRQGRAVLIVEFGCGRQIVYKPRSMGVDVVFQQWLHRLNAEGLTAPFKTLKVLDRGEYGWMECVTFAECRDENDAVNFHRRLGSLLCLFHILAGTDLHLENIIACGEHPIAVDLETIFHPRVAPSGEVAQEAIYNSVVSVGLLPNPIRSGTTVVDKSGIGAVPNQVLAIEVDGFEKLGTDEARVIKVPGRIGKVFSRPLLNGQLLDTALYFEHLDAGFEECYRALLKLRPQILESWLNEFAGAPVRVVLRASSQYASLLNESSHPQLLGDALEQDLLFLQLARSEVALHRRTLPSELNQIGMGDIPYFYMTPASRDLYGADGAKIAEACAAAPLEMVRNRFKNMGEQDLEQQRWFVQASFASAGKHRPEPKNQVRPHFNSFMDIALFAGRQLHARAIRNAGQAHWVGLKYVQNFESPADGFYQIGVIDQDLYSGVSGIALFLAHLAAVTGDKKDLELAEQAYRTAWAQRERLKAKGTIGVFNGLAALAYLQAHLFTLWKNEEILVHANSLIPDFFQLVEKCKVSDLIAGLSGFIPVALQWQKLSGDIRWNQLADIAAKNMENWNGLPYPRGFAHGRAGAALGLAHYAKTSGAEDIYSQIRRGLAEERALLTEKWTDIPGNERQIAWCHGAPGIAIGRLGIYQLTGDRDALNDAHQALNFMLQRPISSNDTLCHGSIGNLEPLLQATNILSQDAKWNSHLQKTKDKVLADINERGLRSPLPQNLIEPGLMMGIAGIGLGALRAHLPEQVPSVLAIEFPRG